MLTIFRSEVSSLKDPTGESPCLWLDISQTVFHDLQARLMKQVTRPGRDSVSAELGPTPSRRSLFH